MKLEQLKEMVDRAERFAYTDDQLDRAASLHQNLRRSIEDAAEFASDLRRKGYIRSGNSLLEVAQKLEVILDELQQVEIIQQSNHS